jgi:tetratricopeptide (TPR) repeat protein
MSYIFISYSSDDRPLALRLADDLARLYPVWIDRQGLAGGSEWSRDLEQALRDCAVFLVVVSDASNASDWVRREILLANQLDKVRVPVLKEGDGILPLPLVDVQYVDFRAEYEGGLQDLLKVLRQYLDPEDKAVDEAHRLLGAGVRAYLRGDRQEADTLIAQALAYQPEIAVSVSAFWEALGGDAVPGPPLAEQVMHEISVVERTTRTEYSPDGQQWFQWSIRLEAPQSVLDQIEYVEYTLHETFGAGPQIVRDRETHFRLVMLGWGVFQVPVKVVFEDGSVGETSYMLRFDVA